MHELHCTPSRQKTVSIRVGGELKCIAVAVSIAMDGSKLPSFVVFKGKPGVTIQHAFGRNYTVEYNISCTRKELNAC